MIKREDLQTINLVQGDTFYTYFRIYELASLVVDRVIFTCRELDLQIDCVPVYDDSSEESYSDSDSSDEPSDFGPILWLVSKDDTTQFRIGEFTYDLTVTVKVRPQEVITFIHNGRLKVLPPKVSRNAYRQYWDYPHNLKKEHD